MPKDAVSRTENVGTVGKNGIIKEGGGTNLGCPLEPPWYHIAMMVAVSPLIVPRGGSLHRGKKYCINSLRGFPMICVTLFPTFIRATFSCV